ncbi:MAG TPA: efflux RND transporter periplasmic adaptor subunit [Bacteroidetes bacterium]|nr:efflux RND transporter periplasmic adaptor subunit [Bacteroidota bacterium]
MKYLTINIMLLLALVLFVAACGKNGPSSDARQTSAEVENEYYTCPMHPSVVSDRPGACPVCGMALVKKSRGGEMSKETMSDVQAVSLSPAQRVLANVMTAPVERRTLTKEINAIGVVDIAEPLQVTVAARFRGRIEKLYVNYTGEVVEKDQPLFDLYSPDLVTAGQDYLLAFNGLRNAQDAQDDQSAQIQRTLLDGARNRLQTHFGMAVSQVSELETTKKIRSTMQFLSPIRGTVVLKQVVEGQYVDEGTTLYQVIDLSKLWIYFDVYEQDIRFVHLGQPIQIKAEAFPDESFTGQVAFIDPVVNSETRTVRVRTEAANPRGKLKPKMFVTAILTTRIKHALVIPASAALTMGNRTVVWVEVKQNAFEPRDVVLGSSSNSHYEVLRGLKDGDVIAQSGGFLIDSESELQQPTSSDPHAGHGTKPAEEGTKSPPAPQQSTPGERGTSDAGSETNIKVLVKGRYIPDVIRAKLGQTIHLHFYRDEDSDCTNEVVFDDFNIRRRLPARKTTTIDLKPKEAGEYHFTCGMGMVHGKLIVE